MLTFEIDLLLAEARDDAIQGHFRPLQFLKGISAVLTDESAH